MRIEVRITGKDGVIESRTGELVATNGEMIVAQLTTDAGDTIPVRIRVEVDHPLKAPQVGEPEK